MQEPVDIRPLYMVAPGAPEAERLIKDLLSSGMDIEDARVYAGRGVALELPEEVTLWVVRPVGGLVFAGLGLGGLLGAAAGAAQGSAVAGLVLGAALGAGAALVLARWWRPRSLGPLRPLVDRGEVVVKVRVPKDRLEPLEERVKQHHPEIMVRGVDPSGSPPFP